MSEPELFVVRVTDTLLPTLIGQTGCDYESPPQEESQARLLIRLLLSSTRTPAGTGPWRRAVAGGSSGALGITARVLAFCFVIAGAALVPAPLRAHLGSA